MTYIRKLLVCTTALGALALAGCGDSSSDLTVTPVPGPGGGGTGGGTGGGATLCPNGTTEIDVGAEKHCRLSGNLTTNVTLSSTRPVQLDGRVLVGVDVGPDGTAAGGQSVQLNIPAGTRVYARTTTSYLVVARGSQLNAEGTQSSPIIFTSANDLGYGAAVGFPTPRQPFTGSAIADPNFQEWGGLVINGRAPLNTGPAPSTTPCPPSSTISQAEGEGNSGCYGGNNIADNSGVLRYVQVKYAGQIITSTNELNSIAFQGVGAGTTVDFVQVHNGSDDGFEFFGGTVDARHLVSTGADDDSFDWTFGWNGRVQFAIAILNPLLPTQDTGIEADNNEFNNDALPRSNPTLANFTIIGSGTARSTNGVLLRRGTAGRLVNFVVGPGFSNAGLDIDSTATYAQVTANALTLRSFFISTTRALSVDTSVADSDATLAQIFAGDPNNRTGASTLVSSVAGRPAFINGANENAVVAVNPVTLGSFFQPAPYAGAVQNTANNWTVGWTFGLN